MVTVLLIWTFALLLSFLYGHAFLSAFQRVFREAPPTPYSFSLVVILGWALLASLGSLWYLFAPLALASTSFFGLLGLAYAVWQRKGLGKYLAYYAGQIQKAHLVQVFLFALALGVALLFSASPPQYYDDGLYYWQFIKWMNEYAAVPGLGNLHPRLAFNSSWHLLTAFFNVSFLKGAPYNDLNGLLYLVVALFALEGLGRMRQRSFRASDAFQASLLIPTHLIVGYFNGPSADAAVVYLVWICMLLFLRKVEEGRFRNFDGEAFLIMVFASFVFTVKLSAFPLVVLPLYIGWHLIRQKAIRPLLAVMAAALLIGLPWIARSVVLSGYPFFPFYQFDFFSVDWKVPAGLVKEEVTYIEAFAAGESLVRNYPYPEILELSFSEWFPLWFSDLRAANKGIFFLAILLLTGYLGVFIHSILRQGLGFFREKEGYLVLFFTLLGGLAFWIFKAPDFRFGYAYTVALYLISLSFLVHILAGRFSHHRGIWWAFAGLILLFSLRPTQIALREYIYAAKAAHQTWLLLPGQPPQLPETSFSPSEDLLLYEATANDQCWGTLLPCTPFPRIGLELRKPQMGFAAGFRIRHPNLAYYRHMQISYQPLSPEEKASHKAEALRQ